MRTEVQDNNANFEIRYKMVKLLLEQCMQKPQTELTILESIQFHLS